MRLRSASVENKHCGAVHYITIGYSRLRTCSTPQILGCGTRSPLYLIGDAASRRGLSWVGYLIPLNGSLNGHPPSLYFFFLPFYYRRRMQMSLHKYVLF